MTHKADDSFFDEKKSWSQRKDEILGCYLMAYFPKIMTVGKPVLIVDGFAGPGTFHDGSNGSPLIIRDCINQTNQKKLQSRQQVQLWCIEKTDALYERLCKNLDNVDFARSFHGTFGSHSDAIANASKTRSVFLYVDPFTVEGLVWDELATIYNGLNFGNSAEVLLNLNSISFLRRARAAMKVELDELDSEIDSSDPVDAAHESLPSKEKLNAVAGGDWWQELVRRRLEFGQEIEEFTKLYCQGMKQWFNEVVFHGIKATPTSLPKYYLVFGTRSIHGLALMNNEMVKSRRVVAEMAKPQERTLFETRSEDLVPDLDSLPDSILANCTTPIKRGDLIRKVIQQNFCRFDWSEIRGTIERLLKAGTLHSDSGKTRINDDNRVCSNKAAFSN